jgi:hypothetical protein
MTKKYTGLFENINSVSDVILAMTEGLKKEWVRVAMQTYGDVSSQKICYGCAATNTLCQLMGEPFNASNISSLSKRVDKINFGISKNTLMRFERALDRLRQGDVDEFVHSLSGLKKEIGISVDIGAILKISQGFYLPILQDDDFKTGLINYENLALLLKSTGH